MTAEVKRILLEQGKVYRRYVKNGRRDEDRISLCEVQSRCRRAIKDAKNSFYSRLANSLNDPNLSSKKYWSILNQFLHKKKTPRIPPIRDASDALIADVPKKANIFNSFFARQCSLIATDSVLPPESFATNLRFDTILLDEAKILALIRALDNKKAYGWDEISIQIIKLCDESLVKQRFGQDFSIFFRLWYFPRQVEKS